MDSVSIASLVLTTEVLIANEKTYTPTGLKYYKKEDF